MTINKTFYLYNIDDLQAELLVFSNGVCRIGLENGYVKFYKTYDEAVSRLYRLGYIF